MIKEAIETIGGSATYSQIKTHIRSKYGNVNESTIAADIEGCTVNNPSRVHRSLNRKPRVANGRYDFLFRTDPGQVTLYDPAKHGVWEIRGDERGKLVVAQRSMGDIPGGLTREPAAREVSDVPSIFTREPIAVDIEANLREYLYGDGGTEDTAPIERNASFDYCFNHFQSFREQDRTNELVSRGCIEKSCLQLGFYLASWGMLRGSSFLLRRSVKVYEPVIEAVAAADPALWDVDAHCYTPANIQLILDFRQQLIQAFGPANRPSDILVTKTMLGVFGNVPAFDSFFNRGFHVSGSGKRALEKVARFYHTHKSVIDGQQRPSTIDFVTGQRTSRLYTRAKLIDMIFWIEGAKGR